MMTSWSLNCSRISSQTGVGGSSAIAARTIDQLPKYDNWQWGGAVREGNVEHDADADAGANAGAWKWAKEGQTVAMPTSEEPELTIAAVFPPLLGDLLIRQTGLRVNVEVGQNLADRPGEGVLHG